MSSENSRVLQRIRGLYGIADAVDGSIDVERLAVSLLQGGCRLIQLRDKHRQDDEVLRVARAIRARCARVDATFILNDRPHLVGPSGAHGVHLGQLDEPTSEARAQMPAGTLLGRSTHDASQVTHALKNADYVAFGPIWATSNTDRDKGVRGLETLAWVRRLVPPHTPLVAIGSITAERIAAVHQAGADAWAVIGAIRDADDAVAATRTLMDATRAVH